MARLFVNPDLRAKPVVTEPRLRSRRIRLGKKTRGGPAQFDVTQQSKLEKPARICESLAGRRPAVIPAVFQFQHAVLSNVGGIRNCWAIRIVLDRMIFYLVGVAAGLAADELCVYGNGKKRKQDRREKYRVTPCR